ncbi:MAG: maleylpyruvate isomerase family mycothiol-dependent enzyme [Chloroflexi bacterium]|nr:maleylpyruvate isomerase family mycothiol-dependent enzyme [Chloroflexota bacterium]MCC6894881.1 maleylpyruvate isomerase family mycothiol-dependent enzyme [Anaerolineae bacterium]
MSKRVPLEPVIATELFPDIRVELERVLESLTDDQWEYPTACTGWAVRDVALHLLGTRIGLLSGFRDNDGQWVKVNSWEELVTLIDELNALWVKAARRISRKLLISLLGFTNEQIITFLNTLDPQAMGGPIGWAGDQPHPIWLHIARELTEQWAHHQHICDAVGITSLKEARFVHPVLSTYVRALPQTYHDTAAPNHTLVKLVVTGEGGGVWHLVREAEKWVLYAETDLSPTATISMDVDTAWRMFTKGLEAETIRQRADFEGDRALAEVMLGTVAIIG